MRWALDAPHRATFDVPAEPRHTLADGLDRLLLGYALPTEVDAPFGGRLIIGLQLPARGLYWVTWDPILERSPSRPDRRWATDRMISFLMTVLRDYHLAHPAAPRVLVGDLSRPFGGPFGSDFGGLGHHSHQNGLDADIFYPRADHTERAPGGAQDVDRALAQDLVSRFVAYGAQFACVGPNVGLGGPPAIVQVLAHHDEHVHVRIANTTSGARSETARR
jgi:murein endopeptidase